MKAIRALIFLLFAIQGLIAQTVTGKVTDPSGEPLVGVSVLVLGTSTGTATKEDGAYTIPAKQGDRLQFSYIGMAEKEVPVGTETTINIVMQLSETNLEEVVVIGYGTVKKENLTGAVDQISAEELESRPINSVGRGLQGLIPNLNVVFTDGTPGAAPQFNIRGITSINGGSPLVLVDGIPTEASLVALLNPSDIESISVLKDAASAAIYGARGAFGVILIKTKGGKAKKPTISYNAFVAYNTPTILPEASTDPYVSMYYQHASRLAWDNVRTFTDEQLAYAKQRSEDPSLPEIVIANTGKYEYYGNTDWYSEIYQEKQPMMQHTLSLTGGTDKLNYYVSGGYLLQDGIYNYDADGYERFNLRTKFDMEINKWLRLKNNTFFNNGIYDFKTLYGSTVTLERYSLILGGAEDIPVNPDGTWTYAAGFTSAFLKDGGPLQRTEHIFQNTLGLEMSFFDNSWKIIGDYTYQMDGTETFEQFKQLQYARYDVAPGSISTVGVNRIQNNITDNRYHVFNLYSSYENRFGKHFLRGMLGFNQELRTYSSTFARRNDLVGDLGNLNLAVGDQFADGSASEWAVRGVFYRLNYSFADKYLLEFNGRYDGTSRFPKDNRFGFFPSASAAWRVSQEPFFQGIQPVLSDLKLRVSYGSLGNQQVGTYAYIPSMGTYKQTVIIGDAQPTATSAPGLVASDLTWERVTTLDFGIDFSLFKNSLSTTFDWYQRETTDMLTKGKTLPAVLGTSEPQENAADLLTTGWELSVNWNKGFKLFGKPFNYNLGAVLSDYTAEITRFDNPNNFLGDFYVGQQFGEIWGYETLGFFQSAEDIASSADHTKVFRKPANISAGDLKFADLNGDGVIDEGQNTLENPGDRRVIGNSLIRWHYGFNGGFEWNNFNLSVFFQGVGKHDFVPGIDDAILWSIYNRPNNTVFKHVVENHWTPERTDAYFPRLVAYIALANGKELALPQTRYLQDASYIRLKNLTFGYTLPQRISRKVGIQRLNIYFSGENLWEHTNLFMPVDPELLNVGGQSWGDGQNYPYQRTYSLGVNVTL